MKLSQHQQYTLDNALTNLVLIEEHLKAFSDKTGYCDECTSKHLLLVSGFAGEGKGFFPGDTIWDETEKYADEFRHRIDRREKINIEEKFKETRELRKKLKEKYLPTEGWTCEDGTCNISQIQNNEPGLTCEGPECL